MKGLCFAKVAAVAILVGGSAAVVGETLSLSGLVLRSDTSGPYGGARLGIYPTPSSSTALVAEAISLDTGEYSVTRENVSLRSVFVLYQGDLFTAAPVRVDLEVRGNARIGSAGSIILIPKPAPRVSSTDDAAEYLAAEVARTGVRVQLRALSQSDADQVISKAVRSAAVAVSPNDVGNFRRVFTRKVVLTSGDPSLAETVSDDFSRTSARIQPFERRPDLNSDVGKDCSDCRPGEAKVETTLVVRHGLYVDINDPPCSVPSLYLSAIPSDLKPVLVQQYYSGATSSFSAPWSEPEINGINVGGDIGRFFRLATNQPQIASCARLVVVLPRSAKITRIEKNLDCPGWCWLQKDAVVEPLDVNLQAISVVAKNWSHNLDYTGTLKVFYIR